ncbi:hypothetical protein ACYOEI_09630 [Singulisphaera rosea]
MSDVGLLQSGLKPTVEPPGFQPVGDSVFRRYLMQSWEPIEDDEFSALYEEQYDELNESERRIFDQYKVIPWKAVIRRSDQAGDEFVFVVAQTRGGVLYFDDVEYGFNVSSLDVNKRIAEPGGSQNTLKEAVNQYMGNN